MEVHHHPNVDKKNLKEYFLEFLMIFLAVALGFFAENIRENISENAKAKELAESLYKEIYSDSIIVQQKTAGRLEKEDYINYFIRYVRDSNLNNLSDKFYPAFTATAITTLSTIFEPKDGILNQLRNSGALRYFKSSQLQEEIGKISIAISNLKARNDIEASFRESKIWAFSINHYEFRWFEELVRLHKSSVNSTDVEGWLKTLNPQSLAKPRILKPDLFDREEAENIAAAYLVIVRGTHLLSYKEYADANHQLLEMLRKEYNAKKE